MDAEAARLKKRLERYLHLVQKPACLVVQGYISTYEIDLQMRKGNTGTKILIWV